MYIEVKLLEKQPAERRIMLKIDHDEYKLPISAAVAIADLLRIEISTARDIEKKEKEAKAIKERRELEEMLAKYK